jgi:hypothetical protein
VCLHIHPHVCCTRRTLTTSARPPSRGKRIVVPTCGVAVTIIDFSNSRLTSASGVQFQDLAADDSLFCGTQGQFPVGAPPAASLAVFCIAASAGPVVSLLADRSANAHCNPVRVPV